MSLHRVRGSASRLVQLTLAFACGSLALTSCGDSNERSRATLAHGCSINSDCEDPLVCVFERCHAACSVDRDCGGAQRCVKSSSESASVCQLPDELACQKDKDCPGQQVCAPDDECRDSCTGSSDCADQQVCVATGQCASLVPGKDHLDAQGNLISGSGGGGGAATHAGGSGNPGGANVGSGGTAGQAGAATDGGYDAGGTAGNGGDDTGGAAGSHDYVETTDGVELINNDDREHALPLASGTLYAASADQDWLAYGVPDDGRAHVIDLLLEQDAETRLLVAATSKDGFSPIGSAVLDQGAFSHVFVSAGPGSTTLFQLSAFGGFTGAARFVFSQTPEADVHEPNDTLATAASIHLNTDVSAQLMHPFTSASNQALDDWYGVDLAAGTATVNLVVAPSEGRMTIFFVTAQNASKALATTAAGMTGQWQASVPTAGRYFIHFTDFAGFASFATGAIPGYMKEPYVFRVEQ